MQDWHLLWGLYKKTPDFGIHDNLSERTEIIVSFMDQIATDTCRLLLCSYVRILGTLCQQINFQILIKNDMLATM